ncbi:MAG: DUF1553 domain-containing protein, partial [Planctomycetales bacterium]|nr:DUF1553 domain-containing protein [Planctomycetales bacterium]
WEAPDLLPLGPLKAGDNEILIVAKNAGNGPNPAGLFFEARWQDADGETHTLATDNSWQWSAKLPAANGRYKQSPDDWQPAAPVAAQQVWMSRLANELATLLSRGNAGSQHMVRAALLKSNFLMRSLGRPNRDQIVSVRPLELTTLEAIDLSNGEELAAMLRQGASHLAARNWQSPDEFIGWLYRFALSREPTADELRILTAAAGSELTEPVVEDILWSVLMLPEFQLVR